MSSSQRSGEPRQIHQDFIARIRYSNALPPPPCPPKLLDIPNTGLASGHYTNPGFASRLAREQPLNIEADAELGMPLDLVGMPGVFDGDESSIQAPAQQPAIHPHDQLLLRPLNTLGKGQASGTGGAFLRRTEYISSSSAKPRQEASGLRSSGVRRAIKRPSPEPDKDSQAYVKRKIDQSFAVAEQNLKDRSRVRHPNKRNLRLVEAYPLLPDIDAFPDAGTYLTIKFVNNPVPASSKYDSRLLSGLFRPIEKSQEETAAYEAAAEAYKRDPHNNPKPTNGLDYEYFIADTTTGAEKFRDGFDVDYPEHDDEDVHKFKRVRAYETAHEVELAHDTKYDEELLLAYNDDDTVEGYQKAAYYYPVMQRTTIRPQRTKNIARTIGIADMEEQIIDQLDVTVQDPTEEVKEMMLAFRDHPYGVPEDPEEDQNGEEGGATNGHRAGGDEVDAEGDEED